MISSMKVDFRMLLKDNKFGTEDETNEEGAGIFVKRFSGWFGNRKRSEAKALEIIIGSGLATDENEAKEVLDYLKREETHCNRGVLLGDDVFKIIELTNSKGEKVYQIGYYPQ